MSMALRIVAFVVVAGAVLFASAGRIDLPYFWAHLTVTAVFFLIAGLTIDPALLAERTRPGPGGISRSFRAAVAPIIVGGWIVAGLDVGRFHWSDTVPISLRVAALAGHALALLLAWRALMANRFFSPVIRIQAERGHHVVDAGPYRLIRHPGYVSTVLAYSFGMMTLGSWLAAALAVPYAIVFVYRTLVEERYLRANLAGYSDYAARVRSRWVPGVW